MVSVMAIGSRVLGSYFEEIRVEVRREILSIDLVCPGLFGLGAQCLVGSVVRLC